MKKPLMLLGLLALLSVECMAKKYPFKFNPSYEIEQVRVAEQGTKFVKCWGIAGNADKAIIAAQQNAVAACIFTGVAATETAGRIPPLCMSGPDAYQLNKDYFDQFFITGQFFEYVKMVNSRYPTGENNVKTSKGRKVGIYLQVMYDALRKRLERDGIIKSLDSYF